MQTLSSIPLLAALALALPATSRAQAAGAGAGTTAAAPAPPRVVTFAPSGRATTEISVSGGARIWIEYGQPHAAGREVVGTLIPLDTVWRAGANRSTQLTTDIGLTIGGTRLPPGSYTLALQASRTQPKLIINGRTRQWGVPYSAAGEIARVPMRVRTLGEPVETFTIALVPNAQRPGQPAPAAPGTGVLTMTWGTMQFSIDFAAQQP